jgi:hypothetical protein
MKLGSKMLEEYEAVRNAIKGASEYGLEIEVVVFALKYMKQDPKLTVEQAIKLGFEEWVK